MGFEYFSRNPPPPGMPGADAGVAAVKDRRQLVLGDDFVERIGHAIVREKSLQRRMELEAADDAVRDQPARLAHAHLALVRIDARERDHHVAVLACGIGDFFVRDALGADLVLANRR